MKVILPKPFHLIIFIAVITLLSLERLLFLKRVKTNNRKQPKT